MTHELKILPAYFQPVMHETKNFELRKDDRGYAVGDELKLCEFDGEQYTGAIIFRRVQYILRDCPGLAEGYCILGLKR